MNIKKDFKIISDNMTCVSKNIIRYGTVLIATLAVSAIFFYIRSETGSDPYFNISMYTAILHAIKECMGAVYILPLIFEILFSISGK